MNLQRLLAFLTAGVLAACSVGAGTTPATPGVPTSDAHSRSKGHLTVRIRVPKRHRRHHAAPAYVSPATQAMTIALTGPTHLSETVGLTTGASGCASSLAGMLCTLTIPGLLPCPSAANCYSATIATYDAVSGCPSACAIPGSAHELSGNQNVGFTIASGQANQLNLTLDGVAASVAIMPFDAAVGGTSSSGFTLSKCFASSAKVEVLAADADGNIILGAGAPTPSLFSNDTAHLAVTAPNHATPNTFLLSRPVIPNAKQIVQLTATASPLPGAGGSEVILQANVTFNSDVCGVITEFSPNFSVDQQFNSIAAGADGNLWFTDCNTNRIGRITTDGVSTAFGTGLTANSNLQGIAPGPDGNVWFAEGNGNRIGRITMSGNITEFSTGLTPSAGPYNITTGGDGNLWFTEIGANKIGRITTNGVITEFGSGITAGASPIDITAGLDGNLWFTELVGNRIGRLTTSGTISEFPTGIAGAMPYGIVAGPDGNLWYADSAGAIGRVTIPGAIQEYSLGAAATEPLNITAGADGNLWFTEFSSKQIGRITPGGTTTQFSGLTALSAPLGIATGSDGAIWFTDSQKIGRLQ
jgi:streptogramin lyase